MKYTFHKIFIKISQKLRRVASGRQTTDILLPYTETEQQPLHATTTALHAYACTLMPHTRASLLIKDEGEHSLLRAPENAHNSEKCES